MAYPQLVFCFGVLHRRNYRGHSTVRAKSVLGPSSSLTATANGPKKALKRTSQLIVAVGRATTPRRLPVMH